MDQGASPTTATRFEDVNALASSRWGFWIAAGIWFLLALAVTHGAHGASARSYERMLQSRVEAALSRVGLNGVAVEMDGQRARLSGLVPNEEARALAEATALSAKGRGGAWWGGVTTVVNEVQTGRPISPYVFGAMKEGDSVVLEGYAPSPRARDAIRSRAEALFRGKVSGELKVAAGAPDTYWAEVAEKSLTQLVKLQRGSVRMDGRQLTIIGEGPPAVRDALKDHFARDAPPDYPTPRIDIVQTGEGIGAAPELKGIDLINAKATDCQAAFDALLKGRVINFETDSAEISADSRALVASLAAVARRCDRFSIRVEGHTDSVGERELNMRLSQARADAVVAVLLAEGVAASRITAVGLGSQYPVRRDDTAAGRAANRRITFVVSP